MKSEYWDFWNLLRSTGYRTMGLYYLSQDNSTNTTFTRYSSTPHFFCWVQIYKDRNCNVRITWGSAFLFIVHRAQQRFGLVNTFFTFQGQALPFICSSSCVCSLSLFTGVWAQFQEMCLDAISATKHTLPSILLDLLFLCTICAKNVKHVILSYIILFIYRTIRLKWYFLKN